MIELTTRAGHGAVSGIFIASLGLARLGAESHWFVDSFGDPVVASVTRVLSNHTRALLQSKQGGAGLRRKPVMFDSGAASPTVTKCGYGTWKETHTHIQTHDSCEAGLLIASRLDSTILQLVQDSHPHNRHDRS